MPICIKCAGDNPANTKYCQKCGAMLPQMAPTGVPGSDSSLDLDENTEYLTPQYRYYSEVMHNLSWAAHDFLEEGAALEPFLEAFDEVKANFDRFQRDDLPRLLESLAEQRAELPDDQYPRQLQYLNTKGVNLYEEGLTRIDSFLAVLDSDEEANPDVLIEGITRILDGNDHFCLCVELCQARIQAIDEALANPPEFADDEEAAEPAAPAQAAEPLEPVASASDDDLA